MCMLRSAGPASQHPRTLRTPSLSPPRPCSLRCTCPPGAKLIQLIQETIQHDTLHTPRHGACGPPRGSAMPPPASNGRDSCRVLCVAAWQAKLMKLQQDLNKEGSEVERPESRPPMQLLNELKAQMQVGSVGTGPPHRVPHPQHAVRKAVPSLKRWRTAGGVSPIPAQMWAGVLPLGSPLGLCLCAEALLRHRPVPHGAARASQSSAVQHRPTNGLVRACVAASLAGQVVGVAVRERH